jgi:hypothetical protein
MWLYPRSSSLSRSFSEELSEAEINTRIHKVLDHGANLNPGAGPAPLIEGVATTKVSLFGFVSAGCMISSSHRARDIVKGLGVPVACRKTSTWSRTWRSRRLTVPTMRRCERKERKQSWRAACRAAKERGEDTPTESYSSDEEEEEGEVTPPSLSPLHIIPPPFSDIAGQQMGIAISERRSKQNQIGTGSSASSPQPPCLVPVTSDSKGMSILPTETDSPDFVGPSRLLYGHSGRRRITYVFRDCAGPRWRTCCADAPS